eukprot:1133652-Pelagomonas_calceolata.AAC.7
MAQPAAWHEHSVAQRQHGTHTQHGTTSSMAQTGAWHNQKHGTNTARHDQEHGTNSSRARTAAWHKHSIALSGALIMRVRMQDNLQLPMLASYSSNTCKAILRRLSRKAHYRYPFSCIELYIAILCHPFWAPDMPSRAAPAGCCCDLCCFPHICEEAIFGPWHPSIPQFACHAHQSYTNRMLPCRPTSYSGIRTGNLILGPMSELQLEDAAMQITEKN